MRKIIILSIIFISIWNAPVHATPVKIGVLAKRGPARCLEKWGPTARYLSSRIPGKSFEIVPLGFHQVMSAVKQKSLDFVLVNPALYIELATRFGVDRIATLKNLCKGHVCVRFGGVAFCRADRRDLLEFRNLKGKIVAAPDPRALGAWIAFRRELKAIGIHPSHDFKKIEFLGTMDAVVNAVRDQKVDAGFVRTGTLERMAEEGRIALKNFRVIGGKRTRGFPLVHSTRMYPEWPFAKLQQTSRVLAEQVAIALMEMSPDSPAARAAHCAGWAIPLNYVSVEKCLEELRLGPFANLGKFTLRGFVREEWPWILLVSLLFFLLIAGLMIYMNISRRLRREIDARIEAEESLRESQERYRVLVEHSHDGILVVRGDYRIEYVNPRFCEILGREPGEIIGHDFREFLDEKTGELVADMYVKRRKGEKVPQIYEFDILRKDGERRTVEIFSSLVRDATGRMWTFGQVLDITERKRAEEALRESERVLRVRNQIAQIFLIFSGEEVYGEALQVILTALECKYGIFGYIDEREAWVCPSLSRDIWDQCQIPDKNIVFARDQWAGFWGKAMRDKRSLYSNVSFRVPKGHLPVVRALDVPIVYQGSLIGNILVGQRDADFGEQEKVFLEGLVTYIAPILQARLQRDRERRKKDKLNLQLIQSQKMEAIGTLAGGVAHDFNNILTAIIGNAELAQLKLRRNQPADRHIEEILAAGLRAATLTRQLLAFSRKELVQPVTLDLNGVIRGLEKMLRRLIGEDVELIFHTAPDLWRVTADPGQMEQVIMNLLVNARDAMPEGGTVTIETANVMLEEVFFEELGEEGTPGPYVSLVVKDSGVGMDQETLSHIFDPFFTTKGREQGTGLGLSTVYGIVKQNDGYIQVDSEPGKGSTFTIYFPKAKTERKDLQERTPQPAAALRCTETILVAEDNGALRRLISEVLRGSGYQVLEARDGKEAIEISERYEGPIHLLLTDVVMPSMGGKELATRLKSVNPSLKILYMSGYTDDIVTHKGILKMEAAFLQKPFRKGELLNKVREVLNGKRHQP